jgi:hypothetical protein
MDFLNTELESDIIYCLEKTLPEIAFEKEMRFWYSEKEFDYNLLDRFKLEYQSFISLFNVTFHKLNGYEETVWFDIINQKDSSTLRKYKFRSVYQDCNELPTCIIQLSSFSKFYTHNRNGYKNGFVKNRNNGFRQVGGTKQN